MEKATILYSHPGILTSHDMQNSDIF